MENLWWKFSKTQKSAAELCQKIRIVTIEIVINYTRVMGIRVTISCRYCITLEVMLLFLVGFKIKSNNNNYYYDNSRREQPAPSQPAAKSTVRMYSL